MSRINFEEIAKIILNTLNDGLTLEQRLAKALENAYNNGKKAHEEN